MYVCTHTCACMYILEVSVQQPLPTKWLSRITARRQDHEWLSRITARRQDHEGVARRHCGVLHSCCVPCVSDFVILTGQIPGHKQRCRKDKLTSLAKIPFDAVACHVESAHRVTGLGNSGC